MSNPAASELPATRADMPWRNLRRAYLVFLHGMALVWGAYPDVEGTTSLAPSLISIVIAIAVVRTCVIDAYLAGRPILHIVQFLMLFSWPVTAPGYLILRRRWQGALWALVLSATLFTAYICGWLLLVVLWNVL